MGGKRATGKSLVDGENDRREWGEKVDVLGGENAARRWGEGGAERETDESFLAHETAEQLRRRNRAGRIERVRFRVADRVSARWRSA